MDAQLKALGDLNVLLQQSQNLPSLINDTQTKKTNIETFLSGLPARSEELSRLTTEVKDLNKQVTNRNSEVSELSGQTKSRKTVPGTFFTKRDDGCRDIRFPDRYSEIGYHKIIPNYVRVL